MPRHFIGFLIRYKYQVIFPVAVFEGPIITMICGFLLSLGYLSLIPTLIIVFLGDVISDTFLFGVGRYGRTILERIKFLHISEERLQKLEAHFQEHPKKTLIITKVSYGVGGLFLMAAGASKMAYKKFAGYIAPMNLVKSSTLLAVGYYFGQSYRQFGSYLQYYAILVAILLPIVIILFIKRERVKEVLMMEI